MGLGLTLEFFFFVPSGYIPVEMRWFFSVRMMIRVNENGENVHVCPNGVILSLQRPPWKGAFALDT